MPNQLRLPILAAALALVAAPLSRLPCLAQQDSTQPVEGLAQHTPRVFALKGARIVAAPGKVIERGVLVVRDGRIEAVGPNVKPPADATVLELTGKTIYPGLIDAYTEAPYPPPKPGSGAANWNDQVRPQRRVADHYTPDKKLNEKYRSQGVAVRLVAPQGGVVKGIGAVVTTGDHADRHAILAADPTLHLRLTVDRGRDRDEYPSSPMGAVALARQTMLDARWHVAAWRAWRQDTTLERPEQNASLAALGPAARGEQLVVIDVSDELYAVRADLFAREFKLKAAIRGSGREYILLDEIKRAGRPVIVPVDFPKAPNVATPESARNVTLAELMHWDIAPENAARLAKAGVPIAFCSHGLEKPEQFLAGVREAVRRGLAPEAALRALTSEPARLLGVADQLGEIAPGKTACLVVTDGPLFDKKTKIFETWVSGKRYEVTARDEFDPVGAWRVTLEPEIGAAQLTLRKDDKKLAGELRITKAGGKEPVALQLSRVKLAGLRLSFTFDAKELGREGIARASAVFVSEDTATPTDKAPAGRLVGAIVWPDGKRSQLAAAREEKKMAERAAPNKKAAHKPEDPAAQKEDEDKDENKGKPQPNPGASFAANYPLGSFGRNEPAAQPQHVVFRGATIWTCDKQGVLRDASLLVSNGKIAAVGEFDIPAGAVIVDLKGKHITPGIIDCHSHMATDGGVNEASQAITAEVRIGDFIDSGDIAIYRQLAGGVTTASILHGSANPIGGQNQVIKLRWGLPPEQLKFSQAPAGIKFALGENVKQSNWGDKYTTRYPQTRMGVSELIEDAFHRARRYARRNREWAEKQEGLPPRTDLELEALAEILAGKRWIHCHSYRQDEILALMRVLERFDVKIGTFQHILEGYKVADHMARHGAMGSAFSDWWAYKFEVYDAIPYNGALMHNAGVVVSFNSDSRELARHLNQEAAKAVKYGGVPAEEALKFVTLNPAKQLRIEKYVGSITPGKHADLAVWSGPPLSNYSRCEQTWIEGRKYFDLAEDKALRAERDRRRQALIQKILRLGVEMRGEGETDPGAKQLWPREDIFCHGHGHHHRHGHGHGG